MVQILKEFEIDNNSELSIKTGTQKLLEYIKPQWKKEDLKFKFYTEGISNKLIGVWTDDFNDQLLVRINGEKTEMFINRDAEIKNMRFLHENKFGPEIYSIFNNGICYAFVPGKTLTTKSVREEHIWTATGRHLAKLHRIEINSTEVILFTKMENFLALLPDQFREDQQERLSAAGLSKKYFENEFKELKPILESFEGRIVFSHNDVLLPNIIWNDEKKAIHFIDFEYAGPNYQPFDIANHFNEFVGVSVDLDYKNLYPEPEFQRKWIEHYLACYLDKPREEVSSHEVENMMRWVNKFALSSHLFWSTWALVQACNSSIDFDFIKYAILRMTEYRTRKAEFLAS